MKLFDAHFHIIDRRFPLTPNNGYLPEPFTCREYLRRMHGHELLGGVIVSGSFQAYDQSYLLSALEELGPSFVGVTQLPASASDQELIDLDRAGVRAVRFNIKRGSLVDSDHMKRIASRVHEVVGWHIELYVDSTELAEIYDSIISMPPVSIDHLGLKRGGLSTVIRLAEKGVHIKATGFGRVEFDVVQALQDINLANPYALMFGTDLPCTRAPRPFEERDIDVLIGAVGEKSARRVLYENALELYRPEMRKDIYY